MSDNPLLEQLRGSISGMQQQMQGAYKELLDIHVTGESHDKTIKITMSCTHELKDIAIKEAAMEGGVEELTWRLREAWKDLSEKIQSTTQSKTLELLKGLSVPEALTQLAQDD